jgi:hypothetical protein
MLLPAFFANAIKKNTLTLEKSVKQRNKKQKKSKEKYIKFPKKTIIFPCENSVTRTGIFLGEGGTVRTIVSTVVSTNEIEYLRQRKYTLWYVRY